MTHANVEASKIFNEAETIWTMENYEMDVIFPYSVLLTGVGLVFGLSSFVTSIALRSSLRENSGGQVISMVPAVHPSHTFTTLQEEAYPVPYNHYLGTHPWRGLKCIQVLLQEKHCKSFGLNYLYFACKLCFFNHIFTLSYCILNYAVTLYISVHSEYNLIISNLRTNTIFHEFFKKLIKQSHESSTIVLWNRLCCMIERNLLQL